MIAPVIVLFYLTFGVMGRAHGAARGRRRRGSALGRGAGLGAGRHSFSARFASA